MKNTDTHKVVLPTGDTSGKAATAIFAEVMNLLIRILTKLGLLKENLDNHVVRVSMIIIYFFFGYQKWFNYEAQALIPFFNTALSFPGCTLFLASGGRVGFWGFRNGCLARSCS
jgi:hypothetical protein